MKWKVFKNAPPETIIQEGDEWRVAKSIYPDYTPEWMKISSRSWGKTWGDEYLRNSMAALFLRRLVKS